MSTYYKDISQNISQNIYFNIAVMALNRSLYYYVSSIDLNEMPYIKACGIVGLYTISFLYIGFIISYRLFNNISNNYVNASNGIFENTMLSYIWYSINITTFENIIYIGVTSIIYYFINAYDISINNLIIRTFILTISTIIANDFYKHNEINSFNHAYLCSSFVKNNIIVSIINIILLLIININPNNNYCNFQYHIQFEDLRIIDYIMICLIPILLLLTIVGYTIMWFVYCNNNYIKKDTDYENLINNEINYLENIIRPSFEPTEFKTNKELMIEEEKELERIRLRIIEEKIKHDKELRKQKELDAIKAAKKQKKLWYKEMALKKGYIKKKKKRK